MHQRQMRAGIDGVVRCIVHLVRLATPEQAHLAGSERNLVAVHAVMHGAADDEIDLDLGVPVRLEHDQRMIVKHLQRQRQALDAAGAWLVERSFRVSYFPPIHIPFVQTDLGRRLV